MYAALFPGQGSQHVGMGKYLCENFASARQVFEEASDSIGQDLKKLCFEGPEDTLNLTHNTQPAILTTSIATLRVIAEIKDINFQITAGHSVGEYASFVIANSISLPEAVQAVRKRGEFMQEAVPVGEGGMMAVMGLTPDQAVTLCRWAEEKTGLKPLSPANFNAPGQIVCSGSKKLIDWIKDHASGDIFDSEKVRLKIIPLKVSAPFHCDLMKPAEDKMRFLIEYLKIQDAQIPIIQNLTAKTETQAPILRENLIRQISGSVLWMQSMQQLKEKGVEVCLELGAGSVLSSLMKKINPEIKCLNFNALDDIKTFEKIDI